MADLAAVTVDRATADPVTITEVAILMALWYIGSRPAISRFSSRE
jgi:hypothetical protein